MFLLTAQTFGCPSTSPSLPRIDEARLISGSPGQGAFVLDVRGGGFVRGVRYDLSTGEARTEGSNLDVRLRGHLGFEHTPTFSVISPTQMRVEVARNDPLPAEIIQLHLLLDGETVARATIFDRRDADAGVRRPDGGTPEDDAGPDAGEADAGPADAGFPDAGVVDSGLGPFVGNFGYRSRIDVTSAEDVPANVTIEVTVPHAALITAGKAQPDGTDLAVYQGPDALPYQWSDRVAVGTDALGLVVELLRPLPAGGPGPDDALALYYGDADANVPRSDAVFLFLERFANQINNIDPGDPDDWFNNSWIHCEHERPLEVEAPANAYCIFDDEPQTPPARRTLATPEIAGVSTQLGPNVGYEASFWMIGVMADGPADIFYLSYANSNDALAQSVLIDAADYASFPPTASLTFEENGGGQRTVAGWRFSPDTVDWWQRARARFVPQLDEPSFHFRFISNDGAIYEDGESGVGIDDFWVRRTVVPAPGVSLGPEEVR